MMYALLRSGLVTRAAFRAVANQGSFGRSVGAGRNSRDSLSRLWKVVERRAVERVDKVKNAGFADVRFLFVFPAVFSSSLFHDAKHLALLEEKPHINNNNNLDIKSYATRGSLVRYLYKTWDLIRFLLSLTKFIMLYSPFLFTYPLCHLSSTIEDLWWGLFKKAIVLGNALMGLKRLDDIIHGFSLRISKDDASSHIFSQEDLSPWSSPNGWVLGRIFFSTKRV